MYASDVLSGLRGSSDTLVFSAGGLRGMSYIGALQTLCGDSEDAWQAWHGRLVATCGTSIGSLAAVWTALGVPLASMGEFLTTYSLSDVSCLPSGTVLAKRVWSWVMGPATHACHDHPVRHGYYLTDNVGVKDLVQASLSRFGGTRHLTFRQLHDVSGRRIKTFVYACSYRTRELHEFSVDTHPDLPVWKAVLASTAIPVIFPPVDIAGRLYVDGGVMAYTPFHRFPSSSTVVLDIKRRRHMETSFFEFLGHVWDCLFAGQNHSARVSSRHCHIPIVTESFSLQDLVLGRVTPDKVQATLVEGSVAARAWVSTVQCLAVVVLTLISATI